MCCVRVVHTAGARWCIVLVNELVVNRPTVSTSSAVQSPMTELRDEAWWVWVNTSLAISKLTIKPISLALPRDSLLGLRHVHHH